MTPETPIVDRDHLETVNVVSRKLGEHGIRLMALGSTCLLLRTGRLGSTKDVDLHPFPVGEDVLRYHEALEAVTASLGATLRWEADGASVTLQVPLRGKTVPVELIEGREEWIQPEVLADAVGSAEERDGVLLPSWEHLVAMKTEAHFDRSGLEAAKYLSDLQEIRARVLARGETLDPAELERVIRMRPGRKHAAMLRTAFRIFEDALAPQET